MIISKIANGVEFRMDEQFQNLLILGIFYGCLRVSINIYGVLWVFMGIYGFLRVSKFLWVLIDL